MKPTFAEPYENIKEFLIRSCSAISSALSSIAVTPHSLVCQGKNPLSSVDVNGPHYPL
ncbi:MAG TPA: hypothetical protein VEB88_03460 [Candidatus Acidoferrales bacterium]|nr:hypothetical protein [Candidatus Acidoferrales bacterium]